MMFPSCRVDAVQERLDGTAEVIVTCPRCGRSHGFPWPSHDPGPVGLRTCPATKQPILLGTLPNL